MFSILFSHACNSSSPAAILRITLTWTHINIHTYIYTYGHTQRLYLAPRKSHLVDIQSSQGREGRGVVKGSGQYTNMLIPTANMYSTTISMGDCMWHFTWRVCSCLYISCEVYAHACTYHVTCMSIMWHACVYHVTCTIPELQCSQVLELCCYITDHTPVREQTVMRQVQLHYPYRHTQHDMLYSGSSDKGHCMYHHMCIICMSHALGVVARISPGGPAELTNISLTLTSRNSLSRLQGQREGGKEGKWFSRETRLQDTVSND